MPVIRSFKCKETWKIFERTLSRKLPTDIQRVAFRKLRMINHSSTLNDLRQPPSNHLEVLEGDRKGQHSIRVNDQWRICFVWNEGHADNVEMVDFH